MLGQVTLNQASMNSVPGNFMMLTCWSLPFQQFRNLEKQRLGKITIFKEHGYDMSEHNITELGFEFTLSDKVSHGISLQYIIVDKGVG